MLIDKYFYFQDIDINTFSLVDTETNGDKNGFHINDDDNEEQDAETNEFSPAPKKKKRGKRRSKKNSKDVSTNAIYMYS